MPSATSFPLIRLWFETLNQNEADTKILAKGYIAVSGYFAASTMVGVAFNIALLRYV